MIIDTSYFQYKPVYIPNATAQPNVFTEGSGTPTAVSQLQQYIDDKEYQLLLNALGYEQLTELLGQFTETGEWKTDALQKWIDLVDGKEEWMGLRYTYGSNKISLISYYVYFYYLKDDWKQYNTTGIQVAKSENAESIQPNDNQVKAWNTFVKMYNGLINGYGRPIFFHNWNGTGLMWGTGNVNKNDVSLYDFMQKNNDVYDTSKFNFEYIINPYNL